MNNDMMIMDDTNSSSATPANVPVEAMPSTPSTSDQPNVSAGQTLKAVNALTLNQPPVYLRGPLTKPSVAKFFNYLRSKRDNHESYNWRTLVLPGILGTISMKLKVTQEVWTSWDLEVLEQKILDDLLDDTFAVNHFSVNQKVSKLLGLKLHYTWYHKSSVTNYVASFLEIVHTISGEELTAANYTVSSLIKRVIMSLKDEANASRSAPFIDMVCDLKLREASFQTYNSFLEALFEMQKRDEESFRLVAKRGVPLSVLKSIKPGPSTVDSSDKEEPLAKKPRFQSFVGVETKRGTSSNTSIARSQSCKGCGRNHSGLCRLSHHPNFNSSNSEWKDSEIGKRFAAKGMFTLPPREDIAGNRLPFKDKREKGTVGISCTIYNESTNQPPFPCISPDFISGRMIHEHQSVPVHLLLDTGSMQDNFVARKRLSIWQGLYTSLTCQRNVCSLHGCSDSTEAISCTIELLTEQNQIIYITITAIVVDFDIPFDIILGRPTIKEHDLNRYFPSHFQSMCEMKVDEVNDMDPHDKDAKDTKRSSKPCASAIFAVSQNDPNMGQNPESNIEVSGGGTVPLQSLFGDCIMEDDDEIPDTPDIRQLYQETKKSSSLSDTDRLETLFKQLTIEGSESLKLQLRHLITRYEDIFSTGLKPTPAHIQPLRLEVDADKWHRRINQGPPRPQSHLKMNDLQKDLHDLTEMGVITPSQAAHYSQVLLVPKQDKSWRLCIDYRRLNAVLTKFGWPLPLISEIMNRLGDSKSKYYAKLDATKGYYQCPLDPASAMFTAFITAFGIFVWSRVPMGISTAASHFHQQLAEVVLAGLLYFICELYMDDILVHGDSEKEFVERLETVFQRLRQFNITLNPVKCVLGIHQVEFLGHVVDENGITMSSEKIERLVNFPKPMTGRKLRSFLGLANYFRDHIRGLSMLMAPLNRALDHKKRESVISWTLEMDMAFEQIKTAIAECPKLMHMRSDLPIFLHTDASDHGIGAYLFQVETTETGSRELPLKFLSKALQSSQLRWSTPEKEAYAIFMACQKFAPVLQDRAFTLRTDHANLVYISNSGSAKVMRWKIALQEFQMVVEHIPGEKNTVADELSRIQWDENLQQELPTIAATTTSTSEATADDTIPEQYRRIIAKVHNAHTGHLGVQPTLRKIKSVLQEIKQGKVSAKGLNISTETIDKMFWPGMRQHVTRYIRSCPCCQKLAQQGTEHYVEPFHLNSWNPMESLSMDTIGPMPITPEGYSHVLVVVDNFTRFVELFALKGTTAEEAASCLLQHFGRYGLPFTVRSDNGPQFVNDTIRSFMDKLEIGHEFTTPYSHEENAIVERKNKEILRHLSAILYDRSMATVEWVKFLPFVQRITNAAKHSATGVSPAELLFGDNVTLDRGIFLPTSLRTDGQENERGLAQWVTEMCNRQQQLTEIAQKVQQEILEDRDRSYQREHGQRLQKEYDINSLVLVKNMSKKDKLLTPWLGPYRVVKQDGAQYQLQNLVTSKTTLVHVSRLKTFEGSGNPLVEAGKDKRQFVVESVVQVIPPPKGTAAKNYHFKIKWLGYDELEDLTIEPYDNVKRNAVVHRYWEEHGLQRLIPPEYRQAS